MRVIPGNREDFTVNGSGNHNCFIVDGIEPGEPVFVLRGNDITAIPTIELWLTMNRSANDAKRQGVEIDIAQFRQWQEGNRPLTKMPD